jgi:hypothetical protein
MPIELRTNATVVGAVGGWWWQLLARNLTLASRGRMYPLTYAESHVETDYYASLLVALPTLQFAWPRCRFALLVVLREPYKSQLAQWSFFSHNRARHPSFVRGVLPCLEKDRALARPTKGTPPGRLVRVECPLDLEFVFPHALEARARARERGGEEGGGSALRVREVEGLIEQVGGARGAQVHFGLLEQMTESVLGWAGSLGIHIAPLITGRATQQCGWVRQPERRTPTEQAAWLQQHSSDALANATTPGVRMRSGLLAHANDRRRRLAQRRYGANSGPRHGAEAGGGLGALAGGWFDDPYSRAADEHWRLLEAEPQDAGAGVGASEEAAAADARMRLRLRRRLGSSHWLRRFSYRPSAEDGRPAASLASADTVVLPEEDTQPLPTQPPRAHEPTRARRRLGAERKAVLKAHEEELARMEPSALAATHARIKRVLADDYTLYAIARRRVRAAFDEILAREPCVTPEGVSAEHMRAMVAALDGRAHAWVDAPAGSRQLAHRDFCDHLNGMTQPFCDATRAGSLHCADVRMRGMVDEPVWDAPGEHAETPTDLLGPKGLQMFGLTADGEPATPYPSTGPAGDGASAGEATSKHASVLQTGIARACAP